MFPQGWCLLTGRPQGQLQTLQCRRPEQPADCHQLNGCTLQCGPIKPVCRPRCGPASGSSLQSPWTQSPHTRVIRTILDAPGDPTDMGKTKFYLGINVQGYNADVLPFICSFIWANLGCGGLYLYAPGCLLLQPFHPLPPSPCLHASGIFTAYRAAAYAGALVCHRWNGWSWQAQEGSRRQVLSMPGWLMAQQICWAFEKGWEQGASFAPQLHGPSLLLGAPACSLYILPCLSYSHLLISKASLSLLSSRHAFLISLLSCSSLSSPVLASMWLSWPEPRRLFLFVLDLSEFPCPPSFNGFPSTLWGWVGAGVSLFPFHTHSPGKECAVPLGDQR